MKRKSRYFLSGISLLLLCLASCRQERNKDSLPISHFPLDSCKTIRWKPLETSYLLSYPESMILTEEYLIVQDRRAQKKLFHVINRKTFTLEYEFVEKGDGPAEYLDATLNPRWDETNHTLSFFDPLKKAVCLFRQQMNPLSFEPAGKVTFSLEKEWVREAFTCRGGYLLMGEQGLFSQHRFVYVDESSKVLSRSVAYPAVEELLSRPEEEVRQLLFSSSFFKISPDETKGVFATYKGVLLQLFDLSHLPDSVTEIRSIQSERPIKKEQVTPDHAGWVYGYEDVYATNRFVYAIYNGETAVDNPGMGKYMLVFDWKGNLLQKYRTDINLRCLCVDEEQGTAYVVGYSEESDFFLARVDLCNDEPE